MLKDLWTFMKQHPGRYILVGILMIAASFGTVLPIKFTQLILDGMLAGTLTRELFIQYIGLFFVTIILLYLFDGIFTALLFESSYRFQCKRRSDLFARLLHFRTPFYQRYNSGDILTRMTSDIEAVGDALSYGFLFVVGDGSWIITFFFMMALTISWQATLLAVIPLVFQAISIYYLGEYSTKRYEEARNGVARLADKVLEMIDGIRVIRAYGKRNLEQKKFEEETQHLADMSDALVPINTSFGIVATFFTGLSMIIGLFASAYYLNQGQMTLGQVVSFQLYLQMISYATWGMAEMVAVYQTAAVSYRKIKEMETSEDGVERQGTQSVEDMEALTFTNYSFTYPEEHQPSLQDISFTLKKGETLGIVGRTGSGKTTLVRQLLRQYPLGQVGEVSLNGQSLLTYRNQEIESLLAYVPQEHQLFSRSVEDNIQFGQKHVAPEALEAVIHGAALEEDLEQWSAGLSTLVGEKGVAVSGGQKQRISIARALLREAEILILDDSLSAVDAKTEQKIIHNIQELRAHKTNIIVTHRLSAIAHANFVLVLDEGRIVESGSPSELLRASGWFSEQYELQSRKEANHDVL